MKQTPANPAPTGSRTPAAESPTSILGGGESLPTEARIASIAGNPTAEEIEVDKTKHFMRVSPAHAKKFGGKWWVCDACEYATDREDSAKQHQATPY